VLESETSTQGPVVCVEICSCTCLLWCRLWQCSWIMAQTPCRWMRTGGHLCIGPATMGGCVWGGGGGDLFSVYKGHSPTDTF
jgi:hypothetical protein